MPNYKLVSMKFSGTSGVSPAYSHYAEPLLFIITGTREEVIMNTGCLTDFYGSGYEKSEKFIITDQENMDIFVNLLKTRVYPMNPETFLILDKKFFWKIIMIPRTELSHAFCERKLNRSGSLSGSVTTEKFPDWQYHIMPTQHPIDLIHNKIKRDGSYLVGINIGEEEHVTKKLPYSFISDLMKNVSSLTNAKFVLFGTHINALREEMLNRECNADMISMVGPYSTEMYAQAISMCDCFISLNRFLLHLSIAIEQDTIGLFYRDEFKDNEENESMLPILYPFVIESECEECNEINECKFIYKGDRCCLNDFDIDEITSMILWILKGEE
jgi:hypothetical protein